MQKTKIVLMVLALAVGALAVGGCGGKSNPTSPSGSNNDGNGNQVTISGFAFSSLTVPKGTAVTWKNEDSSPHTATSDGSSAFQFNTGTIPAGATSGSITFSQSGTFAYHCTFHSGMHGSITVQ